MHMVYKKKYSHDGYNYLVLRGRTGPTQPFSRTHVSPLACCVDSTRPILTSYLRLAAKVALVSIFPNLKAPREPLRIKPRAPA